MTQQEKNEYQKAYRKQKIHRVIIFEKDEYQFLLDKSKKERKPFITYVRELALAKAKEVYIVPFDKQTAEVKILLIRYGTNLNQIAHITNSKKDISLLEIQKIQKEFTEMRQGIQKIYNTPIKVKDLVQNTLIKNPDYFAEIQKTLNKFK